MLIASIVVRLKMSEMENKQIASFKFESPHSGEASYISVRVVGNWIGFGIFDESGDEGDLCFDINIAKQVVAAINKAINLASKATSYGDQSHVHVATIRVDAGDPDNCGEIKVLVRNQVVIRAVMDWTGTVEIYLNRETALQLLQAFNDAINQASKFENIN
jgi:hypothetical protein